MKMIKVILLIIFCLIGFFCTEWARSVNNKIHEPTTIDCEGGVCEPPEEWKDGSD